MVRPVQNPKMKSFTSKMEQIPSFLTSLPIFVATIQIIAKQFEKGRWRGGGIAVIVAGIWQNCCLQTAF